MVLKAIGKFIDTLPIKELFSQEEHLADTVTFEVDRFHNGQDLAEFAFFIRGVTESGGETQTALDQETDAETLRLHWHVNDKFTAEAGTLALDLYGCCYAQDADPLTDPPACIIRYQLPAVQVHGLPESGSILESHSYTDFLLEVKAAANDAVAMLEKIIAEFEAQLPDYDAQIGQLQAAIKVNGNKLTDHENRIDTLEARMEALTPVIALTQAEFDALAAPDAGTLYVVTE